jgi:hypothetical protein
MKTSAAYLFLIQVYKMYTHLFGICPGQPFSLHQTLNGRLKSLWILSLFNGESLFRSKNHLQACSGTTDHSVSSWKNVRSKRIQTIDNGEYNDSDKTKICQSHFRFLNVLKIDVKKVALLIDCVCV